VATSVRAKPYQLAIRGVEDLGRSLPVLAADADEMFEILFADLAGVADDVADVDTSGSGISAVVNDTNVTGSFASGTLTLGWSGTLSQARGGFGQSSATRLDGQLPIGRTSDGAWVFATITAGSGISVTNGAGSITIAATGSSGVAANVALSRVYLRG
jgi:hypothetical protein